MQKKVALIIGASRGIGRETALLFAKNGYEIAYTYNKSEKEANSLQKELIGLGSNPLKMQCDLGDVLSIKKTVAKCKVVFKKIDFLVIAGAISKPKLLIDASYTDILEVLSINLTHQIVLTRDVIKIMLEQKCGSICFVSSIYGLVGGAMESVYSSSKGGIIAFAKAVAHEYELMGIHSNVVAPNITETDMVTKLYTKKEIQEFVDKTPQKRLLSPKEVAKIIFETVINENLNGELVKINI